MQLPQKYKWELGVSNEGSVTWSQNSDYNRSLTPVETFDIFVPTADIFLASKLGNSANSATNLPGLLSFKVSKTH